MDETKYESGQLLHQVRKILDRAEDEKRKLNADERNRYNLLEDEYEKLTAGTRGLNDAPHWIEPPTISENSGGGYGTRDVSNARDEFRFWRNPHHTGQRHAFNRYLVYGQGGINDAEFRALQVDNDTAGGYLVMPMALQNEMIMKLQDQVVIRRLAKQFTCENAQTCGIAALDNDPGSYDISWSGELTTGSEDSTMDFDQRVMTPHPLARRIKVSDKLLRSSTMNPENVVRDRLTYVFAIAEEYQFLQGDGTNKPLGLLTASAAGINTDRDVTAAGAASITSDEIWDVVYNNKAQYGRNGTFIVGRTAMREIRQHKDGQGRWVWEPSMQKGEPSRIGGYPVWESEYMPAFSSGNYVMIFGDFSFYGIADALTMRIQRLVELYAETAQVGFIARKETDGMPLLSEAFTRLKLA